MGLCRFTSHQIQHKHWTRLLPSSSLQCHTRETSFCIGLLIKSGILFHLLPSPFPFHLLQQLEPLTIHPGPISLGSSFHNRFYFIRGYNPRKYEIELGKWERGEKESNQGCVMKLAASKFKWFYDPEVCLLSSRVNSFPGLSTTEQKGYGWFPTDSLYWASPSSFCVGCQQLITVLVSGVLPESQYEVIATWSYVLSPRGSPQPVGWPFASIHTLGCPMGGN